MPAKAPDFHGFSRLLPFHLAFRGRRKRELVGGQKKAPQLSAEELSVLKLFIGKALGHCIRQGSNLKPSVPKTDALSN